ncbi:nicotinate (nicotinamide) nucleotide adenylyltransferase [Gracilimonas amylolytica]|uniref:nicotinate (nicotinamide) nucleotide adenylyltransferase n=1 Tax=Gracilimonas amylolytica TaxID=1749045 RepID=UPI000CD92D5F|nr:nicotinate (nicotinamide) nucleotide adenylyltransferase [Gracilimonas amylolytica]
MSMRIGLFGGTFDPVHNGHISIVRSFLKSGYIDKLWILLTPVPPHKLNKEHVSYDHRKEMLRLAFQDVEHVSISTIEQTLPKPSYMVQTVTHLAQKYPEDEFSLCIGEDSMAQFHTWKDYRKLLEHCQLLVAERPDTDHSEVGSEIMEKVQFIPHDPVEASSTEIRELLNSGNDPQLLLPDRVYSYIKEHKLYQ